jgi:hypothetical protein
MDTFEIKIHIDDEQDLYNSFDESRTVLNDDLLSYIEERYTEKEIGKKLVLIFSGAEMDEENLISALRHHLEMDLEQIERSKRVNFIRQLRLFLIGVVFVAAGIILDKYLDSIPVEIISVIGSFSLWEAANIWIVENPDLRLRKMLNEWLMKAEVRVE